MAGSAVLRPACLLLVSLLLVGGLLPPTLRAEDEGDPPPRPPAAEGERADAPLTLEEVRRRVEGWLADLSSSEFAVREAARKALLTHGASARDLLAARRDDEDPEVRRTVRVLLDRLGQPEPPTEAAPSGDPEALGRVNLEARGTLPFLLGLLGDGHGASFDLPEAPEGLDEVFHEVAVTDRPFYEALGTILSGAQLRAPDPFDPAGRLALVSALEVDDAPWAAAGPMRVRLIEVTSVRTLAPSGGRRYVLALDLQWTPSVQMRQWQTPTDLEAKDAEGRAYRAGGAMRANVTYGTSPSARRARLNLHLEPEDAEAAEHLAQLTFKLPVTLRHDRQAVRFGPLSELEFPARRLLDGPGTTPGDADHVTLRALDAPTVDREPYTVDLLARLTGQVAQESLTISVERADGSIRPANAGSRFPSADGTIGLRARAWLRDAGPPLAVHVSWFCEELRGSLTFTLRDVPLR